MTIFFFAQDNGLFATFSYAFAKYAFRLDMTFSSGDQQKSCDSKSTPNDLPLSRRKSCRQDDEM
jgi:hypothetical protein